MSDIDNAAGATASVVQTVLNYAATPWKFAGLIFLALLAFGGVMTYVEREAIATYVLKNLGTPRLDEKGAQAVLTRVVRQSRARGGTIWKVDLANNLQTILTSSDYSGEQLKQVEIGFTYPVISTGSSIKVAAALMNGQSICYDPTESNELPAKTAVENGVKWLCSTSIPNGLGAFVGLIHIFYNEKPDQYLEQACLRAMAEAATELTVR